MRASARARAALVALLTIIGGLPTNAALAQDPPGQTILVDEAADPSQTPAPSHCDDAEPGNCSLRDAVARAAGLPAPPPGDRHTIRLTGATTTSFPVHWDITLPTTPLLIDGAGHILDNPDRGGRTFTVPAGADVVIRNVTVRNGVGNNIDGGCTWNAGTLRLEDVVYVNCTGRNGGAIYNDHVLTIVDGRFTDNGWPTPAQGEFPALPAALAGGALFNSQTGRATLTGTVLDGNQARNGGAIFTDRASSELELVEVTLYDNHAEVDGGAIEALGGSTLTVNGGVIGMSEAPNTAGSNGGAIALPGTNSSVRIDGVTIGSNTAWDGGAIWINTGLDVTDIVNSAIVGNRANNDVGYGGGIYVQTGGVTVTGGRITDNEAGWGGGIAAGASSGAITLDRTLLWNNTAPWGSGGGVWHDGSGGSTLLIEGTTLRSNVSPLGANVFTTGDATIVNSTITGGWGDSGAGLYHAAGSESYAGHVMLSFVTVTDNVGSEGGAVTTEPYAGDTTIHASAVTGNRTPGGDLEPGGPSNCSGLTPIEFEFQTPKATASYSVLGTACDASYGEFDGVVTSDAMQFADLQQVAGMTVWPPLSDAEIVGHVPGEQCTFTDQVGQSRSEFACTAGAVEHVVGAAVSGVTLTVPAQVRAGATVVPLKDVPPAAFTQLLEADPNDELDGETVASLGLSNVGLSNVGLSNVGLSNVGMSNPALGDIRLVQLDLPFSLAQLPLLSAGGWGVCIDEEPLLEGVPLQALTIADLEASAGAAPCVQAIELRDLDVANSALASIGLLAAVMGDTPLTDIALPGDADGTSTASEWCAAIDAETGGNDCAGLDPATDSLTDATLAGVGLSNVGLSNVGLSNVGLSNVGLSNVGLSNVGLSNVGLSNVGLSNVGTTSGQPEDAISNLAALGLSNVGLSNVGLSNVGLSNVGLSNVGLSNVGLQGLGLSNVGLSNVGLSNVGLSNVGLSNVDLGALGLSNVGLSNVGLSNVGLSNVGLSNVGLSNVGLSNVGLSNVGLSNVGLSNVGLSNVPLGGVTVQQLMGANVPMSNVATCGNGCPAGKTLRQLELDGQLVAGAKLADVWLYFEQAGATLAILLRSDTANWPSILGALTITENGTTREMTLGDLYGSGFTVQNLIDSGIWLDPEVGNLLKLLEGTGALDNLQIGHLIGAISPASAWMDIPLGEFVFDLEPQVLTNISVLDLLQHISDEGLAQVPLFEFLASIDHPQFLGLTLGQLLDALSDDALSRITLGDLLLALLTPADVPWDEIDLDLVDWSQYASDGDQAPFEVSFHLAGVPGNVSVSFTLPPGFRPDTAVAPRLLVTEDGAEEPGPATEVELTGWDPVKRVAQFDLTGLMGDASYRLVLVTRPGFALGPHQASVDVIDVDSGASGQDTALTTVVEAFEPNDTPADLVGVPGIHSSTLYFTTIGSANDHDLFPIEVGPAERVALRLFGIPDGADVDLALWRVVPASSVQTDGTTIPSGTAAGVTSDGNAATHRVEDVPAPAVGPGEVAQLVAYSGRVDATPEEIRTVPLPAGRYYAQVFGYNQDTSIQHVALQYERSAPYMALPACATFEPLPTLTSTSQPDIDAGTDTLFVYSPSMYTHAHGVLAAGELQTLMTNVANASSLGVTGALVPLDAYQPVLEAYAAWHADRCDVEAAIDAAAAVTKVIDDIRAAHPTVENVVLVGDDLQVPFWRLQDHSPEANQTSYASTFNGLNNEIVAATAQGYFFSDDPHVSDTVISTEVGDLHLPGAAIGRLVESHADITMALENFLTYDGLLDPTTITQPEARDSQLVTGYHFLTDGTQALADALESGGATRLVQRMIHDTWTVAQLVSDWLGYDLAASTRLPDKERPEIASVNGHMSHLGLLSGEGDLAVRVADDENVITDEHVLDVTEFDEIEQDVAAEHQAATGNAARPLLDRRLVMTMGCNSGLSVSDVQLGTASSGDLRHLDWAQTMAGAGAAYLANAGFAYGDTDIVEYSERLYGLIAENLDGAISVGDAVRYAKHAYAARQFDEYEGVHHKVAMEVITYGLPMLQVPGDGVGQPLPTPPALQSQAGSGQPASVVTVDLDVDPNSSDDPSSPNLVRTQGSRGTFWSVDGEVIGSRDNPVQPLFLRDVTQHSGGARTHIAHGVMPLSLTHTDQGVVDPHIVRPIVVNGEFERESNVVLTGFPAKLATVASMDTPGGARDQLAFVAGRVLRDETGNYRQRLFHDAQLEVLYAPGGDPSTQDWTRPTILGAYAANVNGTVHFTAEVTDRVGDVGIVRVLYYHEDPSHTGPVVWHHVDLQRQGGHTWTGAAGIPTTVERVRFAVFAADGTGNTATTSDKGRDRASQLAPPDGGTSDVAITLSPDPGSGGTASGPVTVGVSAPSGSVITVDGHVVASGHEVAGDGLHVVEVRTPTGGVSRRTFSIDSKAPTLSIGSPMDGLVVRKGTGVEVRFSCADASPLEFCRLTGPGGGTYANGQVLDTATLPTGTHTFTLTGKDTLGHEAAPVTATLRVITFDAPTAPYEIGLLTPPYTVVVRGVTGGSVDFGDGSAPVALTPQPDGSYTAGRKYTTPGMYRVTLSAHGATFVHRYAVAYDPSGDFVTGGGAIHSPRGAYRAGPTLSGPATFGFVSQYKKGANVPTGNTRFEFEAGGMTFKSTSYEWLVVAGGKAKFKGAGQLNGQSGFGFMLTAVDGHWKSGANPDRLRMRIWRLDDPSVIVYDNQELAGGPAVSEDAELSDATILTEGSVVIHERKRK